MFGHSAGGHQRCCATLANAAGERALGLLHGLQRIFFASAVIMTLADHCCT
jgi:hypothetical protein